MHKTKILLRILSAVCGLVLSFSLCACSTESGGNEGDGGVPNPPKKVFYTNPVFEPVFADPTVIRDDDGTYYAYGTSDYSEWDGIMRTAYIPMLSSKDLVTWKYEGDVFTASTRPDWKPSNFGIWAPDIVKIGNTYNLYYSFAGWGDAENSAIGVATAEHPLGPWRDKGCVITTQATGVKQCIDSFTFVYENKVYMIWGSYYGMFYIELSDDGLSVKPGAKAVQIGGKTNFSTYEGAWLTQKDNYWYLFTSHGNCCEGLNTNYYVNVFRAESPFGPYYGEDGKPMLGTGLGTNVIRNSASFVGCGHNAVTTDDNGDFWMIYHGYDVKKPGTIAGGTNRRALCVDKLYWTNGWPHTKNYEAAYTETECPYIAER